MTSEEEEPLDYTYLKNGKINKKKKEKYDDNKNMNL